MDTVWQMVGIFLGALLGQFTVSLGWIATGLGLLSGYFKRSWFSIQLIAFSGGLLAKWLFQKTSVDERLGGLAGSFFFNVGLYFVIAILSYSLGWVVMRVVRRVPEE